MQVCEQHWQKCRDAIQSRGLWHLVSEDGKQAMDRMAAQVEGDKDAAQRDPLMDLTFMLYGRCIEIVGLAAMGVDETPGLPNGGHICPLCVPRESFDMHLNAPGGHCGDPNCAAGAVTAADTPWDDLMLASAADHLLLQYRTLGLVTTN